MAGGPEPDDVQLLVSACQRDRGLLAGDSGSSSLKSEGMHLCLDAIVKQTRLSAHQDSSQSSPLRFVFPSSPSKRTRFPILSDPAVFAPILYFWQMARPCVVTSSRERSLVGQTLLNRRFAQIAEMLARGGGGTHLLVLLL